MISGFFELLPQNTRSSSPPKYPLNSLLDSKKQQKLTYKIKKKREEWSLLGPLLLCSLKNCKNIMFFWSHETRTTRILKSDTMINCWVGSRSMGKGGKDEDKIHQWTQPRRKEEEKRCSPWWRCNLFQIAPRGVMESMMFLNKANQTRESLINIRLHHFPISFFAFSSSHLRNPEFNPPHLQDFVFKQILMRMHS